MGERLKVLGTFAILGFLAGVIANVTYHTVVPGLLALFPQLIKAEWMLSGLAGAMLTIVIVTVWAYLSRPTEAQGR